MGNAGTILRQTLSFSSSLSSFLLLSYTILSLVLRACPLPTVSGNGITLRGNLWVTPGIAAAKPRATLLVYDSARQTFLSSLSFFLLFSFTILSLATKLITFHSLLACVCSICARP